MFTIPQKDGSERFVMLRITGETGAGRSGRGCDCSDIERRRIEHERDYDVLTGPVQPPCLDARAKKLFRMPESQHAALLMMDM